MGPGVGVYVCTGAIASLRTSHMTPGVVLCVDCMVTSIDAKPRVVLEEVALDLDLASRCIGEFNAVAGKAVELVVGNDQIGDVTGKVDAVRPAGASEVDALNDEVDHARLHINAVGIQSGDALCA